MLAAFLLVAALAMFGCVACNKLSARLGIPALLAFIALGMLFGSEGLLKIPFSDYHLAENVCSVSLIFIMFYGGFGTSWRAAKPAAVRAVLLSSLGVFLTAAITGLFCRLALHTSWLEGMLIGAVLGSTDAASVFSILRARSLALKDNTDSLLEVESGSNDPCAYMLTAVLLAAMQGQASVGGVVWMIFAQVAFGVLCGVGIGLAAIFAMKRLRFGTAGFDAIFAVAVAILAYAAPTLMGGNGYLSVYIAGILLGNSDIHNKRTLVPFFDGTTGLAQLLLFFLLGLLCTPHRMGVVLGQALLIALFLTFVARPAAVWVLLTPFKATLGQKLVVSWAGLRGAASIVFAVMTVTNDAVTHNDLFHIVFMVVLFSISFQGSLLPLVAKKLDMLDESGDVRKTFTDYTDESPVQFIEFTMPLTHPWTGLPVREAVLPPDTLLISLRRGEEQIIPHGNTVLQRGDVLVLCAHATVEADARGVRVTERRLTEKDVPPDKIVRVRDLPRWRGAIIMLVQRGDETIIPDGDTLLQAGDVLVAHRVD